MSAEQRGEEERQRQKAEAQKRGEEERQFRSHYEHLPFGPVSEFSSSYTQLHVSRKEVIPHEEDDRVAIPTVTNWKCK